MNNSAKNLKIKEKDKLDQKVENLSNRVRRDKEQINKLKKEKNEERNE